MPALDGTGGVVRLADGERTVTKMRTRRLVVLEARYGGLDAIQRLGMSKLTEVTAALMWAAELAESEDDALDLLDGVPLLDVFKTMMVELIRSWVGDEAAAAAIAEGEKQANGQGADPTTGATAPLPDPGPVPIPSLS